MDKNGDILLKIKKTIQAKSPDATIILYGSRARGEHDFDSDFDILILLNQNKITRKDEIMVKYPLYDIEFDTGKIISPFVLSKKDWESRHKKTPFYENVMKDGIVL